MAVGPGVGLSRTYDGLAVGARTVGLDVGPRVGLPRMYNGLAVGPAIVGLAVGDTVGCTSKLVTVGFPAVDDAKAIAPFAFANNTKFCWKTPLETLSVS